MKSSVTRRRILSNCRVFMASSSSVTSCVGLCIFARRASDPIGSVDFQRAVLDQVAHPAHAETLPEGSYGVADHRGIGASPNRGVAWQMKHGTDLTEVISAFDDLQRFLSTAG